MMKAGTETGSLVNHLYSEESSLKPEIGMGATILYWIDRHAATIVKVTPTQIHVQRDKATRTDNNGMSESQEYTYEADVLAPVEIFRKTKRGYRDSRGNGLRIGSRKEYYDYSF